MSISNVCFVVDKFDTFTVGETEIAGLLGNDVSKVVTSEEVPSSSKVFNSRFVNEIKDPCLYSTPHFSPDFYIRPPREPISQMGASSYSIVKVIKSLLDFSEASTTWFAIYHPHYKEKLGITESAHEPFLLWQLPKPISLLGVSSDCVVKAFAIYHPHYKEKIVSNSTRTFVCAANCLYFLCDWSNLSVPFFLAHDSGPWAAEPGIGEPLRTALHLSCHLQHPFLLGSTLSEMRSTIFEYLAMPQCAAMSEWGERAAGTEKEKKGKMSG